MVDKLQYSSQLFESLAIKWGTEWSYRIAEIIDTVQRQDQQNIIFSIWQSNGKYLIKHSQQNIKWSSITACLPTEATVGWRSCTAGYDILLNKTILKLSKVPQIIKIILSFQITPKSSLFSTKIHNKIWGCWSQWRHEKIKVSKFQIWHHFY